MSDTRLCPNCGRSIPTASPGGHCPACLLQIGWALGDAGMSLLMDAAVSHSDSPDAAVRVDSRCQIGDYELLEEVGRGGMGVVYRARQKSLGRIVALKLVRTGDLADADEISRFHAEAAAAAHLNHPNIVPIYEVGEDAGRHYFSMRLMEGGTLARRIRDPLSSVSHRLAVQWVAAIARAVHHAHQRGVMHRDIKPGNILMDPDDMPHVTDFGLAKRFESEGLMSVTGSIVGTPGYMAPEQIHGASRLTTAVDVYGLGALLYEVLSGRPPFVGRTILQTLQMVSSEEPASFPKGHGVEKDLETVCLKCLAKDPAGRYGSAEAVADDLERWLRFEPVAARPSGTYQRLTKWTRRNPVIAVLAMSCVGVLVLGLITTSWQWRKAAQARVESEHSASLAASELRKSQLSQLQLLVGNRRQGQRMESLRIIRALGTQQASPELRDFRVTALASVDVVQEVDWRPLPFEPSHPPSVDEGLTRFAMWDDSGAIRWFAVSNFMELGRLSLPQRRAVSAEWVHHDQWMNSIFDDGQVVLWDLASKEVRFKTTGCSGPGQGQRAVLDPSGHFLAMSGSQNQLQLFNVDTGKQIASERLNSRVESISFHPAGDRLVVSVAEAFELRSVPELKLISKDPCDLYFANQMRWEPRGRWFYAATQGWDVLRVLPGFGLDGMVNGRRHSAAAQRLLLDAEGNYLVSYGVDNAAYLWDGRDPDSLLLLPKGIPLRFDEKGRRFMTWRRGIGLASWQVVPTTAIRRLFSRRPHTLQAVSCEAQASLPFLTTSSPHHATVYDLRTGEDLVNVKVTDLTFACLTSDARHLITVAREGVHRWPLNAPKDSEPATGWSVGEPSLVRAVGKAFLPQATIIPGHSRALSVAGSDESVVIHLETLVVDHIGPAVAASSFSLPSRDGRTWRLVSNFNGEAAWLERDGTSQGHQRLGRQGGRPAIGPTGRDVMIAGSDAVICYDTDTWNVKWSVPVEQASDYPVACAFSMRGDRVAVSLRGTDIAILETSTGKILTRLMPPAAPLAFGVCFARDDREVCVATMRGVYVWDLASLVREQPDSDPQPPPISAMKRLAENYQTSP